MVFLIIFILAIIALGVGMFFYNKIKNKGRLLESFDMALFLVTMPKYEFKKEEMIEQGEEVLIAQMEQIFSTFLSLKTPNFWKRTVYGPPRMAFEIASQIGGSDISFYVAVPTFLETAFEKYVQGVYSRALVEKVPQDYTIFEPAGATAGCYLKLSGPSFFPISTYKNLEKDALATITNTLSKIRHDEGAAVQVVIRPFTKKKWSKVGDKILGNIREGKPIKLAIAESSRSWLVEFLFELNSIITGQKKNKPEQDNKKELPVDEKIIEAIQSKVQKQVFDVNIRLMAAAETQIRAEEILGHLRGAFGQFSLYSMNGFDVVMAKKKRLKKLIYDFSFRNFSPIQGNILNIEELASIYHFPTHYIETPYIKTAKSGVAAPPSELPDKGLNLIGQVTFRGEEKDIYFSTREDRRRHFYLVGQTGTGKTSLLQEMIRQDILNGEGLGIIDPHGELIEATLANIPKERVDDVVLFEPSDMERPIGLNMLEYDTPEQKDFAVQEMIAIFHKLFPPEIIGPMFEHYMRNAMLALMADKDNPGTLVEIPRMFTDDDFMQKKLMKVEDPIVKNFWLKEWKQTTGATRSDMLGYVVSKVGRFIENEMMRNIIGQSHSGFDLGEIMDGKKIFLANLSKGLTGEVNSSLLGLILVSKMQMAAMKRARVKQEERADFYLYIDEFQNFTTDSITTILSEARKYRLNLILAHQYIPQLEDKIRDAVLGNVGTIGAYRISADDAELLEKQFEPEFSRFDLVNLDNFNLVIKMLIDGKVSNAFKFMTYKPKDGNLKQVESIKKISSLKYGKLKSLVEREIAKRSNL
ncbi:type IV secretion system DNA-binding domain-containing protein [Patescibacteria group bacterium]|nr:type IV secretion system DNA-binding domain-containing protein [Patescibacteria group bacterium]MBU4022772.1 type IV secretion system DNA-binding domain-containing protein [Patescibacteria group bacterium]MBU4162134.1 type IV secretion system DNA-binding domain-containing protein [Patescibacteria group bacterium]